MRKIAARFYIRAIEKFAYQGGTPANPAPGWARPAPVITVKMAVVSGNRAPENKTWASSTPSGEITMTIGDPASAALFNEWLDAGHDIAVTFEPRPQGEVQ